MGFSDLSVLQFVRAAAQTGSFSAAAEELGFSQPAVSQRIRRFEREIGVALFVRTPSGVIPTEAGEVLLRHSLDALECIQSAHREIETLRDLQAGHVRVVAFPSIAATVLPSAIAALRHDHPNVTISFRYMTPEHAIQSVADGTSDLALTYSYDSDSLPLQSTSLVTYLLMVDPVFVSLSKDHRLAGREEIDLGDLMEDEWLLGYHAEPLARVAQQMGFVPRQGHTVIDYPAAQGFISENLGVALMPGLASISIRQSGIVCRRLLPEITRSINMTVHATDAQIPAVSATIASLRYAAPNLPSDPTALPTM